MAHIVTILLQTYHTEQSRKETNRMKKAFNFTKKDEINSVSATPLQKAKNEVVTITGAAITERPDDDGNMRDVALLSTVEHGMMSGISATALKSLDLIIDYANELTEEELADGVKLFIKAEKSNAGRDFITLEIV